MAEMIRSRGARGMVVCAAMALAGLAGGVAMAAQQHAAVPESAVLVVYLPREPLYAPRPQSGLLDPYKQEIEKLPVRDAMLSSVGNAVLPVKWISKSVVGKYKKGPDGTHADPDQIAQLMRDDRTDSVVLLQVYAQLTAGLKGLMVAAMVDIAEKTVEGPIEIKHKEITATVSIANAGAPLSRKELMFIRRAGARARARIWFARSGDRVNTATLLDLVGLEKQLRAVLASPVGN